MIDDDDVDFAVLAWPSGGWVLAIIGAIVIIALLVVVERNKEECAAKHCDRGNPMLIKHECLCVEKAAP
jgi:hypothetical protein